MCQKSNQTTFVSNFNFLKVKHIQLGLRLTLGCKLASVWHMKNIVAKPKDLYALSQLLPADKKVDVHVL